MKSCHALSVLYELVGLVARGALHFALPLEPQRLFV